MDYVRELASLKTKLLTESKELHLNNISFYKNKAICRICAIEIRDNVKIYYGIDSSSTIYFGPHSCWESIFYNYETFRDFILSNGTIKYSKKFCQEKITEFLLNNPHSLDGIIK